MKQALLASFYGSGNGFTEKLNELPKFTQLVGFNLAREGVGCLDLESLLLLLF